MHKSKKSNSFPFKHYFKVSFVYFVVFVMIFSIIDYYALMVFNFLILLIVASVLGLIIGFIHTKKHIKDNIDMVAEELL